MRKIDGYVCIAQIEKLEVLFGQNTTGDGKKSNVFVLNDLTPFATLREAHAAGRELLQERRDITAVSFGRIRMQLATADEEIYAMKRRKSLVVVRMDREFNQMLLIGAVTAEDDTGRGPRYPVCGQLLMDNGIKPFTEFEPALWTAREEVRQAQCPTSMAIFSFKRLKPLRSK